MKIKKVPVQLYKDIQSAVKNICRYDRIERYVLVQVLTAAERQQAIEDVFIKCAEKALQNRPVDKLQLIENDSRAVA